LTISATSNLSWQLALLTPWHRILLQKLIDTQLEKILAFMELGGSLLYSQKPAIGPYLS
jgi:hypothetical protein